MAKIQCDCETRAQTTREPSVSFGRLVRLKVVKDIDVTISFQKVSVERRRTLLRSFV